MISAAELFFPVLLYFASWSALCLPAASAVRRGLPSIAPRDLRLAVTLLGALTLNAVLVQTLGLLGLLRIGPYLALCGLLGGGAWWLDRRERPVLALARLLHEVARSWIVRTPYGLGWAAVAVLAVLAYQSALVEDMDSLSIHGPLVVGWIQDASIDLQWFWNYPLTWEFQIVPNFLLLRSDVLVILPRVLACGLFVLLLSEVGRRLRLPAASARLAAWLCALSPLLWGALGEGTMKNDSAMACGLLLAMLALERLWRRRPGGLLLLEIGAFFLFGTKAVGVALAAGFLVLAGLIWLVRSRPTPRRVAFFVLATLLLQANSTAVQWLNVLAHGNPFYPVALELGGVTVFDGRFSLRGMAILDHLGDPKLLHHFLRSSAQRIGIEFLLAFGVFFLALMHQSFLVGRNLLRTRSVSVRALGWDFVFWACLVANLGFWLLYIATPWSAGVTPDSIGMVRSGMSLRYTIGSIGLTYILAASYLHRFWGGLALRRALIASFLFFVGWKWVPSIEAWSGGELDSALFAAKLCLVIWLGAAAERIWRTHLRPRCAPSFQTAPRRRALVGVALLAATLVFSVVGERVDARRARWWGQSSKRVGGMKPIWQYVRANVPPGSRIAVNGDRPLLRYYAYGSGLDNRLISIDDEVWDKDIELPDDLHYAFISYRQPQRDGLEDLVQELLRRDGWRKVAADRNGYAVFLVRDPSTTGRAAAQDSRSRGIPE